MSDQKAGSWQEALDRRSKDIVERALANDELMNATREGIASVLRGEKGVPPREVQEKARQRHEGR